MSAEFAQSFKWDISLPLSWTWMSAVREMVNSGLRDRDEFLREEITMVASELAENVVKYGEPVESLAAGSLQLLMTEDLVRIISTNGVSSPERARHLSDALDQIRAAPDPQVLYLERMKELVANPMQTGSGLGLLRIAYEGEFQLNHRYEDQVLTITAERKLT
jgi:hypothetical protein